MDASPIYLDHAATTRAVPPVCDAMQRALDAEYGNPSARHPLGARAKDLVEGARAALAAGTGADRKDVVFTSGGTEANNLGVLGIALSDAFANTRRTGDEADVLLGPTEHASVRACSAPLVAAGLVVESLRLTPDGALDVEHAASRIGPGTRVVAQMLVNNEFGTRYDVTRLARATRTRGGPQTHLHVDAVQAFGKLPLDVTALFESHNLSGSFGLSAHKVHGPKGAGALILARGSVAPRPLLFGGPQEDGRRPGTENVPAVVGFGAAAEMVTTELDQRFAKLVELRRVFEEAVAAKAPDCRVLVPYADPKSSSPHVLSLLVPGAPAEVWLHHLEERGVFASAGSACQAQTKMISPGLLALGLDAESARRVLRFSFATSTTAGECRRAAEHLGALAGTLAGLTSLPG